MKIFAQADAVATVPILVPMVAQLFRGCSVTLGAINVYGRAFQICLHASFSAYEDGLHRYLRSHARLVVHSQKLLRF